MCKLSLIVPIYGVERYIRQFAESALDQSYDDIQFIFVNDGTKDRSMEILEELIEERFNHLRSRIIIINKEANPQKKVAHRPSRQLITHNKPDGHNTENHM